MTCFHSAVCPLLLMATVIVVATGNQCRLEPDTGPCRAAFRRFYYNWNKQQCQEFVYGGCGGNANRFNTLPECKQRCADDVCQQPQQVGPCRASIRRWFYNRSTGMCERFIYGGCGGNANRFVTLPECKQRCADVCQQPKQVGPCRAFVRRWFYNRNTRKCEQFTYGGCAGNANRFVTLPECKQRCADDVCQQPKQVGPCRAAFRRWFYNRNTRKCEWFIYGGCRGNRNNFQSLRECRHQCMSS